MTVQKPTTLPKPATLIVNTRINVHVTGKLPSNAWMLLHGKRAA